MGEEIRNGKRFEPGKIQKKEEGSHRCAYVKVERKYLRDYMGIALEYYNGLSFPVIQRVSAGKQDCFPWEEGCDGEQVKIQKILGVVVPADTP